MVVYLGISTAYDMFKKTSQTEPIQPTGDTTSFSGARGFLSYEGNLQTAFCNATLVETDKILTAQHCVPNAPKNIFFSVYDKNKTLKTTPVKLDEKKTKGSYTDYAIDVAYKLGAMAIYNLLWIKPPLNHTLMRAIETDQATLILRDPLGISQGFTKLADKNTILSLLAKEGTHTPTKVMSFHPGTGKYQQSCQILPKLAGGYNVLPFNCYAKPGFSGSGLFVNIEGTDLLVGTLSHVLSENLLYNSAKEPIGKIRIGSGGVVNGITYAAPSVKP